jgi:hypothetical protein
MLGRFRLALLGRRISPGGRRRSNLFARKSLYSLGGLERLALG